jgi:hypothetical protein
VRGGKGQARHGERSSDVYERPAVMPDDPATVAGERAERAFVEAKRAAGVSWFNLAVMTGRTVADLKRKYGGGK